VADIEREVQPLGEPVPQAEWLLERDGEGEVETDLHAEGDWVAVAHDVRDAVGERDSVAQPEEVEEGVWVRDSVAQPLEEPEGVWLRVKVAQPVGLIDTAPTVCDEV
jgi:hypothetical protein